MCCLVLLVLAEVRMELRDANDNPVGLPTLLDLCNIREVQPRGPSLLRRLPV